MKRKNTSLTRGAVCAALLAGCSATLFGAPKPLPVAPVSRTTPVDFQNEILPIFRNNCLACHNRTKAKGDLILESPKDIVAAKAVVPGDAAKSTVFKAASHADDPVMPPLDNKVSARSLTPQELGLIKLWIEQGAKGEVRLARDIEWQPLPAGLNPIYSVAVTADGQYAAAGRANQIFIYHLPTKTVAARLTDDALLKKGLYKQGVAHLDMVHALDFSEDGTLLASGGFREVKLWRRQQAKPLRALPINSDAAIVDVSPDGKWIAAAEGNDIKILDYATGAASKTLSGHKALVQSVAFAPDSTRLLSGAADGAYHIWTLADGKFVAPKLELEKPSRITAATWTTSGTLLVTAHEDNVIRAWDMAGALTINETAAKAVADATKAAADRQKAFDVADKAGKDTAALALTAKTAAVKAAAALAAANTDAAAKVADTKAKADLVAADKAAADAKTAAATAQTELTKSRDAEKAAQLLGLKPLKELKGHTGAITGLSRIPGVPTQVLSGSKDGSARHWDAAAGTSIRSITHGGPVAAIAVSPDGQKFASAGENNIARVWNATSGAQISEVRGLREPKLDQMHKDRLATFAKAEVAYHVGNVKAKQDAQKQADERIKKGDEAKKKAESQPIAEKKALLDKALADKKTTEDALAKFKTDIESAGKAFEAADKAAKDDEAAAAKAKADAVAPVADATTKGADATAKKTAAAAAMKQVETFTNTQLKPAETKLVADQKALADADKVAKDADKALADAKAGNTKAQTAFAAADKVAKDAEELAKKIAGDAAKKPEEKDAANKDAAAKRALANTAKAEADKTKAAETTAGTAATTAGQKLTQAQANVKTAETALATAKTQVATATTAYQAAEKASADATKAADAATLLATKAKTVQADAEKLALGKRKVADDIKAMQTKLNADQTAATTKLAEIMRNITTAETEFKKLDDPRQEAVNEFNLATKAKGLVDEALKKAETDKTGADNSQKQADAAATAAKEAATKAEKPMRSVAFSADGQMLLTGGDDHSIQAWAVQDGQPLATYAGHTGAVKALALTVGGKLLSVGADKVAREWSLASEWKLERTLGSGDANSPISDRVNAIDFSVDGQFVASGSGEPSRGGEIKIWTVADGKLQKDLADVHSDSVLGLAFSRDGRHVASASADKFVKVTDLSTGKVVRTFEGHTHHAMGVAWHPHGRQLVSTGADKSVRHWNFETGERGAQRVNFGKEVSAISYVGFTDQAVVASGDKTVRVINASSLGDVRSLAGGTDYMYACATTPDAQLVVAGGQDSTLRVWTLANASVVAAFDPPKPPEEPKAPEKK